MECSEVAVLLNSLLPTSKIKDLINSPGQESDGKEIISANNLALLI